MTASQLQRTDLELIRKSLPNAFGYEDYRQLVAQLAKDKATTGSEQKESLINYTILNDKRMARWDKTLKIPLDVEEKIKSLDQKVLWLVLTESWCGDASPALPVMNKIASLTDNIELKLILRDEHSELMNRFLTKGAMSIPKLISVDVKAGEILGTWGPRPSKATAMASEYKKEHGLLTPEFKQELQVWYNKDKGENILQDLLGLLALE